MIKKLLSVILTVCMIAVMMPEGAVFADTQEITIDGIIYSCDAETGTAAVTGYDSSATGDITLPSNVEYDGAAYRVTEIRSSAFYECKNLISITVSENVTTIGRSAFASCDSLESISVAKGNSGYCSDNGVLFEISEGTDEIKAVKCPAGKTGSYEIPDKITVNNTDYTVNAIGESAFAFCTKLDSVTFASGSKLKTIGERAFWDCIFTGIELPDSVESIETSAFTGCESLKGIKIPAAVAGVDGSAFQNCKALVSITVDEGNANYSSQEGVLFDKNKTIIISYPVGKTGDYTIPKEVKTVGSYAFSGYENGSIAFEEGSKAEELGDYAFSRCGFTTMQLPDNLKAIGNGAFYNCRSLADIKIPSGVTGIGNSAFLGCRSLTAIEIPAGMVRIGKKAFESCSKLESIEIPAGVTAIEKETFYSCTALAEVKFAQGSNIKTIGKNAFYKCSSLKNIELPNSLNCIEESTFNMAGLTEIIIPGSVREIKTKAFAECRSLEIITLTDSIEIIGDYAFNRCEKLMTVLYEGTLMQWEGIDIGYRNSDIKSREIVKFINVKPEPADRTYSSITLKTVSGAEYSIDGGRNWQETPVFTGLSAGTAYTFEVRYKADDDYEASVPVSAKISTLSYTSPSEPAINITDKKGGSVIYDRTGHTVTITPGDNYCIKEIYLDGIPVPVTDETMVLENIYGWSRISVTFEKKQEDIFVPDKYISSLKLTVRSSRASKGNICIKVTSVTDSAGNPIDLAALKEKGYVVKFKFYRSTEKSSKYTAKVEKDTDKNSYINTAGKKGTKYYYKVRVIIYDSNGSLVSQSGLKQCRYAARLWN